jgi:hypothetical protein
VCISRTPRFFTHSERYLHRSGFDSKRTLELAQLGNPLSDLSGETGGRGFVHISVTFPLAQIAFEHEEDAEAFT